MTMDGGKTSRRKGVVAMPIECTEYGLKIINCNIFYNVETECNGITAADYLTYNKALKRMFDHGVDGIIEYLQKHMSHLLQMQTPSEGSAYSVIGAIDPGREADADWQPEIPMTQAERDAGEGTIYQSRTDL